MTFSPFPLIPSDKISGNVLGIGAMVLAMGALTSVDGFVKEVGKDMHAIEIVFFRNLFGLVALTPLFVRHGMALWRTQQLKLQMARGAMHSLSMVLWFWALLLVPLADATALSFMLPIFASIGAVVFLAEPNRGGRWFAAALGFAGMLIIIRPGFTTVSIGMVMVVVSGLIAATSKVFTKVLARTDTAPTIVAYLTLNITLWTFIPALFVWQWPSPKALVYLALIGALGVTGHLFMTWAYRVGEVTAVEPAYFTRLIWAALIGFVAFGEVPQIWTWVGAGVIVAGAIWLVRHEGRDKAPVVAAAVDDKTGDPVP